MSSFDVFVHGFQGGERDAVRVLMRRFALGRELAEVIELSAPCVVVTCLPEHHLNAYREALEDCGAHVQFLPSGEPAREPRREAPSLSGGHALELPLPVPLLSPTLSAGAGTMREAQPPSALATQATLAAGSAPEVGMERDTQEQPRPQARQPAPPRAPAYRPPRPAARPHAPAMLPRRAPNLADVPRSALGQQEHGPAADPVRPRISTEARVLAAEVAEARRLQAASGAQRHAVSAPHPLEDRVSAARPTPPGSDRPDPPSRRERRRRNPRNPR